MDLKDEIKYYREKKHMTKSELSRRAGVSPSYITKLENGEKTNPSLEIQIKIAKALEIPLNELISCMRCGVRYTINKNVDFRDIKKYREKLNLSQETLSELIGIKLEDLKGLEAGTVPNPRIDYAARLNHLFNPNPPFTLEEIEEPIYEDSDLQNILLEITDSKNSENKKEQTEISANFHKYRPFFRTFSEYKENIFLYWEDIIRYYPLYETKKLTADEITEIAKALEFSFKLKIEEINH